MKINRLALVTSVGSTLDAFFVPWVKQFRAEGLVVSTFSGGEIPREPLLTQCHTHARGLSQRPSLSLIVAAREFRRFLTISRPDLVLTSTATASGVVRSVRHWVPVVYFCHGLHWETPTPRGLGQYVAKGVEWLLAKRTDGFIAINREDVEYLTKRGGKVMYLKQGVGLSLDDWAKPGRTTSRSSKLGTPRVLVIGALERRKQPFLALDIMRRLWKINSGCVLAFAGEGGMRAALEASLRPDERRRVEFLGRANVLDELSKATVVLHTASWEGLPRSLLESVAFGNPTVALDAKGVRDVPGVMIFGRRELDLAAGALAEIITSPGDYVPGALPPYYDARIAASSALSFLRQL